MQRAQLDHRHLQPAVRGVDADAGLGVSTAVGFQASVAE